MISPSEYLNPEIRSHLRREFKRGLTEKDCLGYHGFSLEALQYVLDRGVIPGAMIQDQYASAGDLFFQPVGLAGSGGETPIECAEVYAGVIARRHYFMTKLRLDVNNEDELRKSRDFLDQSLVNESEYLDQLERRGFSKEDVWRFYDEAYRQRGLVLGIAKKLPRGYRIVDTEQDTEGWKIVTNGQGLGYEYILGIKLLGDREKKFLAKL